MEEGKLIVYPSQTALEELYQPSLSAFTDGNAVKNRSKAALGEIRTATVSAAPAEDASSGDEEEMPNGEEEHCEPPRTQLVQASLQDRFARVAPPARRERSRTPPSAPEAVTTRAPTLAPRPGVSHPTVTATPPASRIVNLHLPSPTARQLEYEEDTVEEAEEEIGERSGEGMPYREGAQAVEDSVDDSEDDSDANPLQDNQKQASISGSSLRGSRNGKTPARIPTSTATRPDTVSRPASRPPVQQSARKNLRAHLSAFASQSASAPPLVVSSDSSDILTDEDEIAEEPTHAEQSQSPGNATSIQQHDSLFEAQCSSDADMETPGSLEPDASTSFIPEVTQTDRLKRLRVRYPLERIQARNKRRRTQISHVRSKSSITADTRADLEDADISVAGHKAEAALSRTIRKEDFLEMSVVGQFNSSFIIVRLRRDETDDLFIIGESTSRPLRSGS